jgi:hypothetical protein
MKSFVLAECIQLLLINVNGTNTTESVEYHLTRMTMLLVSQVNTLRWCFNESFKNCLMEFYAATEIESSLANTHTRPYILHIQSGELFAFYLLIVYRHYNYNSLFKSLKIPHKDFPSYALHLYKMSNCS